MCCLILCNVVSGSLLLKKLEAMFCSLDFLRVSVREQLPNFCCCKYLFWHRVLTVLFCKRFVVFIVRCGFSTDILSVSMLFGVVVCKCVTSLTTLGGGGGKSTADIRKFDS
jgi:hypothetical protein